MIRRSKQLDKRILIAIIVIGLLLPICLFLGRGWIRGPLLNWYADSVYLPKIERAFDQSFNELDQKLAPLGLTFDTHNAAYLDAPVACHDAMYEGLALSKYCYKIHFNDNPGPEITDEYRELWRTKSQAFEDYVLASGWTKTWNAAQPINELLIRDDRDASVGVNYEKQYGKVNCRLFIWYNAPSGDIPKGELSAEKSCNRDVEFFGGY